MAAPVRWVLPGSLTSQFNVKCTTWIAGSIGDAGRKEEWAGMWPGTRFEPANPAAIRREHRHPQTCCCNRLHIRPCPKLVRQERKLQRKLQSKQSGLSSRLLVVLVHGVKLAPRILFLCSDSGCRRLTGLLPRIRTPRLQGRFPQTRLPQHRRWRRLWGARGRQPACWCWCRHRRSLRFFMRWVRPLGETTSVLSTLGLNSASPVSPRINKTVPVTTSHCGGRRGAGAAPQSS